MEKAAITIEESLTDKQNNNFLYEMVVPAAQLKNQQHVECSWFAEYLSIIMKMAKIKFCWNIRRTL